MDATTSVQQALPLEKPKRVLRKLNASQMFKLTVYVEKHYVESGLTEKDFAQKASQDLGFTVSDSSVATARDTLGIISNRDAARAEAKAASPDPRLEGYEKRLLSLEAQVRKLFARTDSLPQISDQQIIAKREELYRTHSAESGDFRSIALVRWALAGGK